MSEKHEKPEEEEGVPLEVQPERNYFDRVLIAAIIILATIGLGLGIRHLTDTKGYCAKLIREMRSEGATLERMEKHKRWCFKPDTK